MDLIGPIWSLWASSGVTRICEMSNLARRRKQTKIAKSSLLKIDTVNRQAHTVPVPSTASIFYVFGEINDKGIIKIGISKSIHHLRMRKNNHETRLDENIAMKDLAFLYASGSDEDVVKDALKYAQAYKNSTEYFKVDDNILAWLRFLRSQPYVAHSIDELPDRPYVTNKDVWLPNKKKQKGLGFNLNIVTRVHTPNWDELDLDTVMEGDYYSPPALTKLVREKFWSEKGIELDPASCNAANRGVGGYEGIGAYQIFSAKQDGCIHPWNADTVWLNPPFKQWDRWVPKIERELDNKNIKEIIIVAPDNAISQKHLNRLLRRADAVLIPSTRLIFWGPKAQTPPNANILIYCGHNKIKFKEVFGHMGAILGRF